MCDASLGLKFNFKSIKRNWKRKKIQIHLNFNPNLILEISLKHDPSITLHDNSKNCARFHKTNKEKKILASRLTMKKVKRWAAKSRQQTPKFKQSQSFRSTEQTCLRTLTHCVFNVLEETKKPKFERNFHLEYFFRSSSTRLEWPAPARLSKLVALFA